MDLKVIKERLKKSSILFRFSDSIKAFFGKMIMTRKKWIESLIDSETNAVQIRNAKNKIIEDMQKNKKLATDVNDIKQMIKGK